MCLKERSVGNHVSGRQCIVAVKSKINLRIRETLAHTPTGCWRLLEGAELWAVLIFSEMGSGWPRTCSCFSLLVGEATGMKP